MCSCSPYSCHCQGRGAWNVAAQTTAALFCDLTINSCTQLSSNIANSCQLRAMAVPGMAVGHVDGYHVTWNTSNQYRATNLGACGHNRLSESATELLASPWQCLATHLKRKTSSDALCVLAALVGAADCCSRCWQQQLARLQAAVTPQVADHDGAHNRCWRPQARLAGLQH